ncbi:MAG: hypothetical protein ABWK01_02170 [Infirmifilum sp.]
MGVVAREDGCVILTGNGGCFCCIRGLGVLEYARGDAALVCGDRDLTGGAWVVVGGGCV